MNGYCQKLSQVTFSGASNFSWFSILISQNILIRISDDGKILEYGTEQASVSNRNYFAPGLIPYSGAISYYQHEPDSALNGKVKNIGTCYFTYNSSKDYPEKAEKLKTVGNLFFDYYRNYDALIAGKIQNIGAAAITYYASMENEALRGKLRSIGNTVITYYSSFDDPALRGKLKAIGAYRLEWTTMFNGRELVSVLKTGNQRQLIDGIIYIPQ